MVSKEANTIADNLKNALSFSLSATKTLAFLVEKYGVPEDFDSVAAEILESNKFIDAIELTRKGVITHVYPTVGNIGVIGYDVLGDSSRSHEAFEAINRGELFFAGPLELRQGGTAVVGRLPIFRDNSFWGFSVVLIRLSTLLSAAGIDETAGGDFVYQLSKRNPSNGKEEFFLKGQMPANKHFFSIEVPDGEWKLYVVPQGHLGFTSRVLPFAILGLILSFTAGLFAWNFALQPEKLKQRIHEVTTAMNAYQAVATESLKRVNRLYHFSSRINHLMVHATDEGSMYKQVCEAAITIGEFKLAWIGLIDEDRKRILPACSAGDTQGYLPAITPVSVSAGDAENPAMRMLLTETYVHCNDIATDPLMNQWSGKALERGYRSSILLPIRKFGEIVGSFELYSHEADCFDEKEIRLLEETANNISFTLENFAKDRRRSQAEQQIQSEKLLSDSIINSLPGIFYLYDRDGKFLRWNRNFEIVSGYHAAEIGKMHPLDFFDGDDRALIREKINNVFASGYDDAVANFYTRDRQKIPYFFNGRKVNFDGIDYLIGMGLDMTEQVKAESDLRERAEEIERLSTHLQNIREEERSHIALEIHDVLGQQLTALKMDATWIKKRTSDSEAVTSRVCSMISLIDDTIRTVRKIASDLRPGILDDLGLIAALEWQGTEFEKNTGIALHFKTNKTDIELERNLSTNIFRVYQEALTNVARHSGATSVYASLDCDDEAIKLVVKDNGKGIDPEEIRTNKSLGLISMMARARLFKGEVIVDNVVPQGTLVKLNIPLTRSENIVSL